MNFFSTPIATNTNATEEVCQTRHFAWNKGMKTGSYHTAESRARIGEAHRGKPGLKGYMHNAETRAKMSAGHLGRTCSEETRAKISAGNKGKIVSAETRAKISAVHLGKSRKGRAIHTPLGDFTSIRLAAQSHNCCESLIRQRIRTYSQHYYYLPKDAK